MFNETKYKKLGERAFSTPLNPIVQTSDVCKQVVQQGKALLLMMLDSLEFEQDWRMAQTPFLHDHPNGFEK